MTIEQQLIQLIKDHPAPVAKVARDTGLTRTTIHLFLNGEMTHKTKLKIAKFLNLTIQETLV